MPLQVVDHSLSSWDMQTEIQGVSYSEIYNYDFINPRYNKINKFWQSPSELNTT